jgi:RNA polymerase sigma-70 factor (ECF subfamily)
LDDWNNGHEGCLVKAARSGDTEAFGQLYEHYAPSLFRYLFSHLDNPLDAEDLTEEVFVRTWRSLAGYRDHGAPFSSYLFRVAHNALADYYRHKKPEAPLHENLPSEPLSDPAVCVSSDLERRRIRTILGQLPFDYRTVLDLRFLAGLTPEETARAMGRSLGAVRVLQHRALTALRLMIENPEDHNNGKRPH